ncbi:MAG: YDG domain-containing protein, partial [Oscillospiraceae bacterium]
MKMFKKITVVTFAMALLFNILPSLTGFAAAATGELVSITAPKELVLDNGIAKADIIKALPKTVDAVMNPTSSNGTLDIKWTETDLDKYDAAIKVAQTFEVKGTATLGTATNPKNVPLDSKITVKISGQPLKPEWFSVASKEYNGAEQTPVVAITQEGTKAGVTAADYDANVVTATEVGKKDVTITAKGDKFSKEVKVPFEITQKPITVTGVTGVAREYNGKLNDIALEGKSAVLVGLETPDIAKVTLVTSAQATAESKDVGKRKITEPKLTIIGAASKNYKLTQPTDITVDIAPKALTVTGLVATDRIYDGTKAVALTKGVLEGVVDKEDITLKEQPKGEIASADAGQNINVTVPLVELAGKSDTKNYTVTLPTYVT